MTAASTARPTPSGDASRPSGWAKLPRDGASYAGPGSCKGACAQTGVPMMIADALNAYSTSDWGLFDNDGDDGTHNSGDDDGRVDFLAFVQPRVGSECGGNTNIRSHRASLTKWGAPDYLTKSPAKRGGFILIDDYVIMPAVACDGKTMIQIGVFAHEFGHAFGLPDLYDVTLKSAGVGIWCLMSSGGWGADNKSPERPVHLSAWAKTMLGWITPTLATPGSTPFSLPAVEKAPTALKIRISNQCCPN